PGVTGEGGGRALRACRRSSDNRDEDEQSCQAHRIGESEIVTRRSRPKPPFRSAETQDRTRPVPVGSEGRACARAGMLALSTRRAYSLTRRIWIIPCDLRYAQCDVLALDECYGRRELAPRRDANERHHVLVWARSLVARLPG